jgi:hypothetical protein
MLTVAVLFTRPVHWRGSSSDWRLKSNRMAIAAHGSDLWPLQATDGRKYDPQRR